MAKPKGPQKPRKGWIYWINPAEVWLKCKMGHRYKYTNDLGSDAQCQRQGCTCTVNTGQVMRNEHPYIVVSSEEYAEESGRPLVFTAIPCTSSDLFSGLPTSYPIKPSQDNGLDRGGYALVNQLTAIDARCFKDNEGRWMRRYGLLKKEEKDAIDERLRYFLDLPQAPDEDWFAKNASRSILAKVYQNLPAEERDDALEELADMEFDD